MAKEQMIVGRFVLAQLNQFKTSASTSCVSELAPGTSAVPQTKNMGKQKKK